MLQIYLLLLFLTLAFLFDIAFRVHYRINAASFALPLADATGMLPRHLISGIFIKQGKNSGNNTEQWDSTACPALVPLGPGEAL